MPRFSGVYFAVILQKLDHRNLNQGQIANQQQCKTGTAWKQGSTYSWHRYSKQNQGQHTNLIRLVEGNRFAEKSEIVTFVDFQNRDRKLQRRSPHYHKNGAVLELWLLPDLGKKTQRGRMGEDLQNRDRKFQRRSPHYHKNGVVFELSPLPDLGKKAQRGRTVVWRRNLVGSWGTQCDFHSFSPLKRREKKIVWDPPLFFPLIFFSLLFFSLSKHT